MNDPEPLTRRASSVLTGVWNYVLGGPGTKTQRHHYKGRLTVDTVSSYNLGKGDLERFLKAEFPQFGDQKYTPIVKKTENEDKYVFQTPKKLSPTQRNKIDRLRESQMETSMNDEIEY